MEDVKQMLSHEGEEAMIDHIQKQSFYTTNVFVYLVVYNRGTQYCQAL